MPRKKKKKPGRQRDKQTFPARYGVGNHVRVKPGTTDPDFKDISLGGWAGAISEVNPQSNPPTYLIQWDRRTLDHMHPVFRKRCQRDDLELETWPLLSRLHRRAFQDFVLLEARPWYRQNLGRLYSLWGSWNRDYFGGALVTPYVMFSEPSCPQRLGDYARVSGFGGHGQVRLRPSLLTGTHSCVQSGGEYAEGRFLFVADVFLHESAHQWQHEVLGDLEDAYHGHGPKFRDQCNKIGAILGLPPVRTSKARGKDKRLPSCAHWPHCVRPAGYYLGAFPVEEREARKESVVCLETAWKVAGLDERTAFASHHWPELVAVVNGKGSSLTR
jgi:hypothetical protein